MIQPTNFVTNVQSLRIILDDTFRQHMHLRGFNIHTYVPCDYPESIFIDAHFDDSINEADHVITGMLAILNTMQHILKDVEIHYGVKIDASNVWYPHIDENTSPYIIYNWRLIETRKSARQDNA